MKYILSLVAIILLMGVIAGCNNNTPAGAETDDPMLNQLNKKIKEYKFPKYWPLDPKKYGIRTFEVTFTIEDNLGEQFMSMIGETETTPYETGPRTGVHWLSRDLDWVLYNDGAEFGFLGMGGERWVSINCELTAPPPSLIFRTVYDGMIRYFGEVYWVYGEDLSECDAAETGAWLFDIQDVHNTITGEKYNKALIIWELDISKPFFEPDFHGKEQELGIELPTAEDTDNHQLTEMRIFDFKSGQVARGGIGDRGGIVDSELEELAELVSITKDKSHK